LLLTSTEGRSRIQKIPVELGDSAMDSERVGQEDQQSAILSRCQLSIS